MAAAAAYASPPPPAYPAAVSASAAPPGTFAPGTKVQVGSHRVVIEKYLSEGGFAHVYVVRVPTKDGKHSVAVLKRVAVPDKDALANMRTEVDTMKKLNGHKHIVSYMDSHASQLQAGGYEVFLLMEFCSGGGLIDFMNTRLQHRLTEPEILHIFGDVSEGVATMHYLKPPLLHRDLKVENVLITKSPKGRVYKLCDFGSTAPPSPAATNAAEGRLIEDDIQRHTTMQYRSPEMVDVWRRQPIDEKSDIWALGVLLYKLCYYTTPFEEVGQMAILNASFKYPHYPPFSDRLKRLIGSMLREDPRQRPNVYQVITEVCSMRGTPVPIKDIYAERTRSESRSNQHLPETNSPATSTPPAGLSHASPVKPKRTIPEIAPMRRGRPIAKQPQQAPAAKPFAARSAAAPAVGGDPFAALDSASIQTRTHAVDELSARFPSLDEFSIAHERGTGFDFSSPPARSIDPVTNALADQVFAQSKPLAASPPSDPEPSPAQTYHRPLQPTTSARKPQPPPVQTDLSRQKPVLQQPVAQRPGYTSTGTMTSPSPTPPIHSAVPDISKRPIWRVPDHARSSSQPRASPKSQADADLLQPHARPSKRPSMLETARSKSQTATTNLSKSPTSSRPSLEGHRPSFGIEDPIGRARSANARPRPVSAAYIDSNLDFLRGQEKESKRPSLEIRRSSRSVKGVDMGSDETNIESDADYLRSLEDGDGLWRKNGAKDSTSHKKRSSLSSLSLSGTKNMIAGKFGDAFKRFEHSGDDARAERGSGFRTPSPNPAMQTEDNLLSPISGSEATATPPRRSESVRPDLGDLVETEDLPPEMRREMERLQLSQEEKRVAAAAAEYRNRAGGGPPVPSKANMIQQRVQSLLEEGQKSPSYRKTAEGYGQYTERAVSREGGEGQPDLTSQPAAKKAPPPVIGRKPTGQTSAPAPGTVNTNLTYHKIRPSQQFTEPPMQQTAPTPAQRTGPRPSAPPKPTTLKTGGSGTGQGRPSSSSSSSSLAAPFGYDRTGETAGRSGPSLAALLARDSEGVAKPGSGSEEPPPAETGYGRATEAEDWQADFSKRYPSLSGIEMVEREIDVGGGGGMGGGRDAVRRGMRIRDV